MSKLVTAVAVFVMTIVSFADAVQASEDGFEKAVKLLFGAVDNMTRPIDDFMKPVTGDVHYNTSRDLSAAIAPTNMNNAVDTTPTHPTSRSAVSAGAN